MIDVSLQRDLGRQVMTVTRKNGEDSGDMVDFRERMLSHNHIDGVLPFEIIREGDEKTYEYKIEDKCNLEEFFRRKDPDRDRIEAVFGELLKTVHHGREYMLSEDDYIIRADTVFVDEEDKVFVPYLPSYHEDLRQQLADLAEYLMKFVDYSDESAVLLVYGFYMRTKEKELTLEDLMKSLIPQGKSPDGKKEDRKVMREPVQVPEKNGNVAFSKQSETERPLPERKAVTEDPAEIRPEKKEYTKPDPVKVFQESPSKLKMAGFLIPLATVIIIFLILGSGVLINPDTGRNDVIKSGFAVLVLIGVCMETEKLMWGSFAKKLAGSIMSAEKESEEATVFLYGDDTIGYPFSLVSDDQPAINVSHFPYFVGKDAKHCDYVMATQVGISRYHLKIDREGEDFTISDLNSTNGTFINGERLAPHLPHKIKRGDELRIGKCIFYCN